MPLMLRALGAFITSYLLVWATVPLFTRWVHRLGPQPIRLDGPAHHHQVKQGKATMGGVLFVIALALSVVIWTRWACGYGWMVLAVCLGFASVGAIDDWRKIRQQNTKGLSPRAKMVSLTAIALVTSWVAQQWAPPSMAWRIPVPWDSTLLWPVAGLVYALWSIVVMVGSANAVNLTDGLDGLATLSIMGCCVVLGWAAHASGMGTGPMVALPGAQELVIVCASIIGSGLAFLWYNAQPSSIIMGDVGALALGGVLGFMALLLKKEWFLALAGGVFVGETLSVVLQVAWFRRTGRRLFLMAPIHHHFEAKEWSEMQVVFRFSIITVLLCLGAVGWMTWR